MNHTIRTAVIPLLVVMLTIGSFSALAQEATETPAHDTHHPAEATPETAPAGMGMMQDMAGMMDMMMTMEMSDEMRARMEEMRGMMDMMMNMGMMGGMMGGMAAPAETDDMAGMDMDTGYSVDNLAPLALAYYQGLDVYFIHPEASDAGVAQVLTDMMGTDVVTVPGLAQIPAELLGNVYVFTNGITAMGPLGFQPDVFDSVPGDESYTPLRSVNLVTWQEGVEARELKSAEEVLAAAESGEVVIEQPGVVVNMPILVWGDQQR